LIGSSSADRCRINLSESAPGRSVTKSRCFVAVVLLILATLGIAGMLLYSGGCTKVGAYSGVSLDWTPALADATMPVDVRACVQSSCRSFTVDQRGPGFTVHGREIEQHMYPLGQHVFFVGDPSLTSLKHGTASTLVPDRLWKQPSSFPRSRDRRRRGLASAERYTQTSTTDWKWRACFPASRAGRI
jgi:hypothetical protein